MSNMYAKFKTALEFNSKIRHFVQVFPVYRVGRGLFILMMMNSHLFSQYFIDCSLKVFHKLQSPGIS